MALRELPEGEVLGGAVAVVIAPPRPRDCFAHCFQAVLAHTPIDVPVLVPDDGQPDAGVRGLLEDLAARGALEHDVVWLAADRACTIAEALNRALAAAPRADVALVHSDAAPAAGWLDGLRAALGPDATVATATAASNHAGFATVPRRNLPWALLPGLEPVAAAARLRGASALVRPRIPTALPHAVLIARAALDLAGPFDAALNAPADALHAFCARASAVGLAHVLADDVLVIHRGGALEGAAAAPVASTAAIEDAAADRFSGLARAVAVAASALRGPSVTVDARGQADADDDAALLALLAGFERAGVRPRVLVGGSSDARRRGWSGDLETIAESTLEAGIARTDVAHRPAPVSGVADLEALDRAGERLVVAAPDLHAFALAARHRSVDAWLAHRRATSVALAVAAAVCVPSRHVAAALLADDLVDDRRIVIAPRGIDTAPAQQRPEALAQRLGRRPFMVVTGEDARERNVPFALRLLSALRHDHGWDGVLVLALAEVDHGSSAGAQAELLALDPALAACVYDTGRLDPGERAWLVARATAVCAPDTSPPDATVVGEAAAAGTPCLFAPVGAFAQMLAVETALLVPWDARESARRCLRVLTERAAGDAHAAALRTAVERLTWDAHVEAVLAAYDLAIRLPAPPAARLAAHAERVEHEYWRLRDAAGYALVDPDGALLAADERDLLTDLARGRRTRPALMAAARALARLRGHV